jgi:drug/metabolite transporter (DMT)-like permease
VKRVDAWILAAFVFAVVILGANWVGVRFSNQELPPFWGATLRFALSGAILFAVLALRGEALPRGRALAGAVVYGIGQYFLTFALIYWALTEVPAGMSSVLFATLPLWTVFVASAVGFERLGLRNVIGALVAIAGLAVIFSDQLTANVPLVHAAAVLLSALTAAGTGVLIKAFPRTHPVATQAIGTAVGVPFLAAVSLVLGERWALPQLTSTWLALAYLVASTCVGFVIMTYVILRWTASAASYGAVLGPVVTVVLATLLAGEVFGPGFFIGSVVVGIGVYIGALAAVRADRTAAEAAAKQGASL